MDPSKIKAKQVKKQVKQQVKKQTKKQVDTQLNKQACFKPVSVKRGGEVILEAIIKHQGGKGQIFGLCGSTTFQFDKIMQNAIDAGKLDYIHVANETSGSYAAQNFSDDKRVGVVITTRGPGITMALSGIASAMREELPLLYICGVSPTDVKDEFQNLDLSILEKVTKKTFRITRKLLSMEEVSDVVEEACFTALHGTSANPGKGPVVLMVDADVWLNDMSISTKSKFEPKSTRTGNEKDALFDLVHRWNKASKIVMRLGPRVSHKTAKMMVQLADDFPQLYLTTVFDARAVLSPDVSPKFLDMSGPVGNAVANQAIKDADFVIDAGVGVLYTTLVIDIKDSGVHSNVLRLFDEPIEKEGYMVNVDLVLYNLLKNSYQLAKKSSWSVGDSTASFKKILDVYDAQTNTLGHYVAACMKQFYNNQLIIDDDYYHVTDSGTAAFIAGQLLRMKKPNDGIYTEFAPIGLSMASAVGKIYGNSKDAVVYLGEGAFMNMLSSFIDLKVAAMVNNVRVLMLLFDDNKYGNVALGDLVLHKEYTSVTETVDLKKGFDFEKLLLSQKPVKLVLGYDKCVIEGFKAKSAGYTEAGLYIMKMDGVTTAIVTSQ